MILQVMVVYDSKARAFMLPFYVTTVEVGQRAFSEGANTPEHQLCKSPNDFTLFHLGRYDDDKAEFSFLPNRVDLGLAGTYVKGIPNVQE